MKLAIFMEENYHRKAWKSRREIIEAWNKIVERNQQKIDDVMQDPTSEDADKEWEDNSSSQQ